MKVECTVNEDDAASAWLLGQKPRREIAIVGLVFALLALIGIAFGIQQYLSRGVPSPIPLLIGLAGLGYCLGAVFWYFPLQVRKRFRQLERGFLPFSVELANDGLHFESEPGLLVFAWANIPRWRENRSLFLVYTS